MESIKIDKQTYVPVNKLDRLPGRNLVSKPYSLEESHTYLGTQQL